MTDPNAARTFRLRCSYVKQGRLALLSHLELAHALTRTVRRADLPFAVSQGFSPHMKIAFGSALPVGVGSSCEIFDIQLKDYVSDVEALAALQAACVPDLMVTDCCYIENSAPAASVAFPFSTYEARFSSNVSEIEVPESIVVVRKRKEKLLKVDEYLVRPFALEGEFAHFTLEAKPTGSLRPDVLLKHCEYPANLRSLTRVAQQATLD